MKAEYSARVSALLGVDLESPAGRRQAATKGAVAALLCWTAYSTTMMFTGGVRHDADAQALAARDAEIAALRGRVAIMHRDTTSLRARVEATVARIEQRQSALARLMGMGGGRMILASAEESDAQGAIAAGAQTVLNPLERVENQQKAIIGQASSATQARLSSARSLLERLGLDPRRFSRKSSVGVGGPLEKLDSAEGVRDLYTAWNSLAELGRAASSIPARMPVGNFNYTSSFGVRYDPFNGGAAMHAGVDMAGAYGEPIEAAAEGVVVRAGWANGYGNMVEIDHGRGITTRYGHMSRVQVKVGDRVTAGDQIGRMGSTGRSTGTHLHYEVRVDGAAVDPMPYLRAAPQIAQIQSAGQLAVGGEAAPVPAAAPIAVIQGSYGAPASAAAFIGGAN